MRIHDESWRGLQDAASETLPEIFSRNVVTNAAQHRKNVQAQKTMLVTCAICVLAVVLPVKWVQTQVQESRQAQWQYLYVKNEMIRSGL